jgi:3-hydroxybutyrate dehydrogenase
MEINNLKLKVFITGGTGTLGLSLINAFFSKGYAISFQYFKNDKQAAFIEEKYSAKGFKIDFGDSFSLPEIDFDIIINNAGINISDSLTHNVCAEALLNTLKVNVIAPFEICKFYIPAMVKKHWGRIININSIFGLRGVDYNLPYNISKHGLSGLTKTIAKEYIIEGITCNEICPGAIESQLMQRIAIRTVEVGTSPEQYLQEVASSYPGKRMALPKEVSVVALFLASEEASYLNGCSIPVEGGFIC